MNPGTRLGRFPHPLRSALTRVYCSREVADTSSRNVLQPIAIFQVARQRCPVLQRVGHRLASLAFWATPDLESPPNIRAAAPRPFAIRVRPARATPSRADCVRVQSFRYRRAERSTATQFASATDQRAPGTLLAPKPHSVAVWRSTAARNHAALPVSSTCRQFRRLVDAGQVVFTGGLRIYHLAAAVLTLLNLCWIYAENRSTGRRGHWCKSRDRSSRCEAAGC